MTAPNTYGNAGMMTVQITGGTATAGGGLASVANPEGVSLMIVESYLWVTTASTGSANLNVGIGAAATTDASDIISALAMNGVSANTVYNGGTIVHDTKTAISTPALWTTTKYLNCTGSASTAGLDATLFVRYLRAPD